MSEPEVHIASFVIQHREDAGPALAAAVAGHADLEIAIPGPTRSVVLCESTDGRAALDRIDQLKDVAGVLNVLLVCHHVEPAHALDEPLTKANASGVPA
ncbi:chaperone NapD [Pseudoxanthomonas sp. NC8]|nr:chaperone NapD [Pseudoxanthomonas sp. NC8]